MEKLLSKITWILSILAGFYLVNIIFIFISYIPIINWIISMIFSFYGVKEIISIFIGIVIKKRYFSEQEIQNTLGIKSKTANEDEIV